MRTHQFVFRCYEVDAFIALVVGFPHRLVDAGQFRQLFQIVVHFLVANHRQHLVALESNILVLVENRTAVVVQLDHKAVCRLDGRHLDMILLDVAAPQVADVRIAQAREALK